VNLARNAGWFNYARFRVILGCFRAGRDRTRVLPDLMRPVVVGIPGSPVMIPKRQVFIRKFSKCKESLKKIVLPSGFRLEKELILRRITGCDSTES
jgi:hypothetical protein